MKILDIPRSGSYAGQTSSRNRFGQYVRNRRAPVQPLGTGRRAFIRAAFGLASRQWAQITADQQAAWDAFAETHPIVNSLGASVILTGHQMYVAVNTQRLNIGDALTAAPPDTTGVPTLNDPVLTADMTPDLTVTVAPSVADASILVAFSPPLSAGRRFPPRFWQATVATTVAESQDIDCLALYTAEFGALILGTRIFCKLTPVNEDGWAGTPITISGTVVAAPGP